jgi:plasmid stabilization system protein ParE
MAYRLTRDAEADLEDIWSYIAQQGGVPDIARNLVESIAARFDILAAHPRVGGSGPQRFEARAAQSSRRELPHLLPHRRD